jgi:hypothetical protein
MCSLQYAAQLEQLNTTKVPQTDDNEKVKELIDMIDVHLAAY